MKIKYVGSVKPGDTLMVGGWCILWSNEPSCEWFGGILPSHKEASEYARANARGRSWRLVPCDGHTQSRQVLISSTGVITVDSNYAI